jgi:hypothetical protein
VICGYKEGEKVVSRDKKSNEAVDSVNEMEGGRMLVGNVMKKES